MKGVGVCSSSEWLLEETGHSEEPPSSQIISLYLKDSSFSHHRNKQEHALSLLRMRQSCEDPTPQSDSISLFLAFLLSGTLYSFGEWVYKSDRF